MPEKSNIAHKFTRSSFDHSLLKAPIHVLKTRSILVIIISIHLYTHTQALPVAWARRLLVLGGLSGRGRLNSRANTGPRSTVCWQSCGLLPPVRHTKIQAEEVI